MQIGHIGLFCNPKILLNSFMFWDFEASSPFLYCPVLSHSNCVSKYNTKIKSHRPFVVLALKNGESGIRTHDADYST